MQRASVQAGRCVFCEFRQSWRGDVPYMLKRGREAPRRAATSIRRVQGERQRSAERSRRASRHGERSDTRRADKSELAMRLVTHDPQLRNSASRNGYVTLSMLEGKGGAAIRKPKSFSEVLNQQLDVFEEEVPSWDALDNLHLTPEERQAQFDSFKTNVRKSLVSLQARRGAHTNIRQQESDKLADELDAAFKGRGADALYSRLKYAFYGHVAASRFSDAEKRNQRNLADLRYPLEWYPGTRSIQRTIHLHVGPTNSGKTYNALKALQAAKKGQYAGPLRLLAHEVFTRMNAQGRRCMLVTGEERRYPDDVPQADLVSCTVEMVDVGSDMDVCVIDEIQMIGSDDRGWAWTQALLGCRAQEMHLCGEERTVPLIKELVAMMGDTLEIHHYQRLSPLKMDYRDLNGNLGNLRKGDCIVSFSILGIHQLRKDIEKQTGKKCAIVYGSLPPETRAQQARLFNDPDSGYDFLVASDAIGMGLNLSIKRIIFDSSQKNDGFGRRILKVSEIKQIAGRAGRYRTAQQAVKEAESNLDAAPPTVQPTTEIIKPSKADSKADTSSSSRKSSESVLEVVLSSDGLETRAEPPEDGAPEIPVGDTPKNLGLVTTLWPFDFGVIKSAMGKEPEPIKSAGIHPPASVVERFATYFPPGTPFSYILLRLDEVSQTNRRFHLCRLKEALAIADAIHSVEGLTTADRIVFCAAPSSISKDSSVRSLVTSLARCVAEQRGGSLLEIPPQDMRLELLDKEVSGDRKYLQAMEDLHKNIILYLWLSYRFTGIFSTRQLAFHVKEMVEKKIEQSLRMFSFTERAKRKMIAARERALMAEMERAAEATESNGEADGAEGLALEAGGVDDEVKAPASEEEAETLDPMFDEELEPTAKEDEVSESQEGAADIALEDKKPESSHGRHSEDEPSRLRETSSL